jgi:G3E family GTPase
VGLLTKLERNTNPSFQANEEEIMRRWDKEYGDRLNELVLIGQDMDKELIAEELDRCLCTTEEYENYLNQPVEDKWML